MKNYITLLGAQALKNELKKLLTLDRPELVKVISWAASNGDRSENGDYIYGKRKLREIDRKIRFLTQRLESAEVIDPEKQSKSTVLFGAIVCIEDEEGNRKTYQIVGQDEINGKEGKISWVSPVGKALLNKKVGDVITLNTPKGSQDVEVLEIT